MTRCVIPWPTLMAQGWCPRDAGIDCMVALTPAERIASFVQLAWLWFDDTENRWYAWAALDAARALCTTCKAGR